MEYVIIFLYLIVLVFIKNCFNYEVYKVIRSIVIEEMMYLMFVVNIFNVVGGNFFLYL